MQVRRVVRPIATGALAVAACACVRKGAQTGPEQSVPLVVRNDGVFDVTIYALPSGGTTPRIRLGLVSGSSTVTLAVPRRGVQPGGSLVLLLHAVGASSSWVSPAVTPGDGTRAYLDIYASPSGDLSRSSFYVLTTGAGTGSAQPASAAPTVISARAISAP